MRTKEFVKVIWRENFYSAKNTQGSAEYLEIMFNFLIHLIGENFFVGENFHHPAKISSLFPHEVFPIKLLITEATTRGVL